MGTIGPLSRRENLRCQKIRKVGDAGRLPMSYEEALKIEADLFNAFEKVGILSFGGH